MDLIIHPFEIMFLYYGRQYRVKVVQEFVSDLNEKFIVIGRRKRIELLSDRPYLRRLKKALPITFKPVFMKPGHDDLIKVIVIQIRRHIEDLEKGASTH